MSASRSRLQFYTQYSLHFQRNWYPAISDYCAALSDEESSDVGEFTTPPRASSRKKSTSAAAVDELDDMKPDPASDEEEGDEEEDLDEDE